MQGHALFTTAAVSIHNRWQCFGHFIDVFNATKVQQQRHHEKSIFWLFHCTFPCYVLHFTHYSIHAYAPKALEPSTRTSTMQLFEFIFRNLDFVLSKNIYLEVNSQPQSRTQKNNEWTPWKTLCSTWWNALMTNRTRP